MLLVCTSQLLLLGELGYLPIEKRSLNLMFQVVAARYETGSFVITTHRNFREWGKIHDVNNTFVTATVDRLIRHGEEIVIGRRNYLGNDNCIS